MTTNDERIRILTLVQEGKIDTAEATQLLQALDSSSEPMQNTTVPSEKLRTRALHIRKTNLLTGKTLVDVSIPANLVRVGLSIGAKFGPEVSQIDENKLNELICLPGPQVIVDSEDEIESIHTEVFLE